MYRTTCPSQPIEPIPAVAVGMKAIEQGIARRPLSESDLRKEAETKIRHAQAEVKALMDAGIIPPPA